MCKRKYGDGYSFWDIMFRPCQHTNSRCAVVICLWLTALNLIQGPGRKINSLILKIPVWKRIHEEQCIPFVCNILSHISAILFVVRKSRPYSTIPYPIPWSSASVGSMAKNSNFQQPIFIKKHTLMKLHLWQRRHIKLHEKIQHNFHIARLCASINS